MANLDGVVGGGGSESKWVLVMFIPPTLSPPSHFLFKQNANAQALRSRLYEPIWTRRHANQMATGAAALAWFLKWMFFIRCYCDAMLDPDPLLSWGGGREGVCLVLEVGGAVDKRRRSTTLQPLLLLGKTALPWPPLWQHLYSTQWSAILGGRWFITVPCLLKLFETHWENQQVDDYHVI